MIKNTEHKPDYLKVANLRPDKPIRDIRSTLSLLHSNIYKANSSTEKSKEMFGYLNEIIRMQDLVILRFDPYSTDLGIQEKDTVYRTRQEALDAAIEFLKNQGYSAKPFDLEEMLKKI